VKYPKLSAAIDELLSKLVTEHGEDVVSFILETAMTEQFIPPPPVEVKKDEVKKDAA
jgi:hypothetical protein